MRTARRRGNAHNSPVHFAGRAPARRHRGQRHRECSLRQDRRPRRAAYMYSSGGTRSPADLGTRAARGPRGGLPPRRPPRRPAAGRAAGAASSRRTGLFFGAGGGGGAGTRVSAAPDPAAARRGPGGRPETSRSPTTRATSEGFQSPSRLWAGFSRGRSEPSQSGSGAAHKAEFGKVDRSVEPWPIGVRLEYLRPKRMTAGPPLRTARSPSSHRIYGTESVLFFVRGAYSSSTYRITFLFSSILRSPPGRSSGSVASGRSTSSYTAGSPSAAYL